MECNFFARLETHLTIGFSRKNRLKRIGTSCNNVVHLLNKAKSRSIMNFKNFENHLDLVCQPASLPASQPASQPAVRPGCPRCRALKITQNNRVIVLDLRNCCSEDNFPTAPW